MFKEQITSQPNKNSQELGNFDLFELYKDDLKKVIGKINEINPSHFNQEISENVGETMFTLSLPNARPGKHAKVFFLDISKPGNVPFECVIRDKPQVAEEYSRNKEQKPILDKYLPKLYSVIDGWVVMEKLKGLELKQLQEKLNLDPDFLSKYTENVASAIYELAGTEIQANDVNYQKGHNVIVSPDNASLKIIEQNALVPDLDYESNENIAKTLFNELQVISQTKPEDGNYKYDFAFQLVSRILKKVNAEDIKIKYRYFKQGHEWFEDLFKDELERGNNYKKMSDEEYENLLMKNPNVTVRSSASMFTEGFILDQEFVKAVMLNDFEKFQDILKDKKFKKRLEDIPENRVVKG